MLRIHIYLVIIRLRPLRKIWIRIRPKVKIRIQGFFNARNNILISCLQYNDVLNSVKYAEIWTAEIYTTKKLCIKSVYNFQRKTIRAKYFDVFSIA